MRTVPTRRGIPLAVLIAVMGVSGCERLGNPIDVLTGKRASPDEFQVLARKPLRMPGALTLPEPRLGETSPLEPDPQTDAVIALLGAPVAVSSTAGGAGERALINAATASTAGLDVRAVEQTERAVDANQPYKAPLITDVLEGNDGASDPDALDPAAEARRLQTEGLAPAPIDPNSRKIERTGSDGKGIVFRANPGTE